MHNVPPAHRPAPSLVPEPMARGFGLALVRSRSFEKKVESIRFMAEEAKSSKHVAEQRYRQSVQTEGIAKELAYQALKRSNAARVTITECKDQADRVREYCAVLIKQKDEKIKQLQQQCSQAQAKVKALSKENEQVKSEKEAAVVTIQKLSGKLEKAEQTNRDKNLENESLREENLKLRKQLDVILELNKQLSKSVLARNLSVVNKQLTEASVKVERLTKENKKLTQEIEKLLIRIRELQPPKLDKARLDSAKILRATVSASRLEK